MIDFAWKRVRVRKWGKGHGMRKVYCVDCKRTQLEAGVWGVVRQKTEQLTAMLTGVAVPVEDPKYPGKLVVFPLECRISGWDWIKIDPTTRYFVVLKKDCDVMGDAYAQEIEKVSAALPLFGFKVKVPDRSRQGTSVVLTKEQVTKLKKLHRRVSK